ncbi:MAG: molybdopterin-dependent oxidoreductase, partial [Polyangiaceae bacterium]
SKIQGVSTSTAGALERAKALFAEASKESVALVLSALHSLEDNWALLQLGALMGTQRIFMSGKPDGYEDDILIHRDKNPNTKGVQLLASGALAIGALADEVTAGRVTHIIALGGVVSGDIEPLRRATIIAIAAHDGPLTAVATVLLPATSWAEHAATYVNARGLRQASEKAIEPQGASKPAWKQVADLAMALGYEAPWTKLSQIRAQLAVEAPAVRPSSSLHAE